MRMVSLRSNQSLPPHALCWQNQNWSEVDEARGLVFRGKNKTKKSPKPNPNPFLWDLQSALPHLQSAYKIMVWLWTSHLPPSASKMSVCSRKPWIHLHQRFWGTLASSTTSALRCDTAKLPPGRQVIFLLFCCDNRHTVFLLQTRGAWSKVVL